MFESIINSIKTITVGLFKIIGNESKEMVDFIKIRRNK